MNLLDPSLLNLNYLVVVPGFLYLLQENARG